MRPQNQTLLAFIIAGIISIGFIGVAAVDYYYAEPAPTSDVIFTSDSNMEFISNIDYEPDTLIVWGDEYGTGSIKWYGTPPATFVKNNCTTIFLGNDTWGATMTGFAAESPLYSGAMHIIMIAVPEAKTHIIDSITLNMTVPTDDMTLQIFLGGISEPQTDLHTGGYTVVNIAYDDETQYDDVIDLNSVQKLGWYNIARQRDIPTITIVMYDTDRDGLPTFPLEISMTMTGTPVSTWSLQNAVNVVIGGSIAFNIAVAVYMTDAIDFGGHTQTLSGRKRSGKRGRSRRILDDMKEEFR